MNQLITFFATGCYAGKLPLAPGTWGTGVGVLLFLLLSSLSPLAYSVTVVACIFFAAWAATAAQRIFEKQDPPQVVIDEIAGFLVTMAFHEPRWQLIVAGFLLFRLFDITKPFPCRWFERRFTSGWGVVLDDVMAGMYANVGLWVVGLVLMPKK